MKYQITVEFESSNLLSERESQVLVAAVLAQIEDPCGVDSNDKRARYSTTITKCQLGSDYFTSTFTPDALASEDAVS
jgi:hypothetical protein